MDKIEINERIYKWIKGWSQAKTNSSYGEGYRDAMRDVLEEIEEFNDNSLKDFKRDNCKDNS